MPQAELEAHRYICIAPRPLPPGPSNKRIWTPPHLQTFRALVEGSTAHVYPVSYYRISFEMLDPNGLFPRWLPIGSPGYDASVVVGFCQRRFDLLAIMRLVMQLWFGYSCSDTSTAEFMPSLVGNQSLWSSLPKRCALSCWPMLPRRYSGDALLRFASPRCSIDLS